MTGIFISHAHADAAMVNQFVDTVIRLGCGAPPEIVFYSSGSDTGVPTGSDLNTHVRAKMGDARLVIAVLTPHFRSRPFCIAELGAAWSRADSLFPLSVPGLASTSLDGVLTGMLVRGIGDATALDELHERVCRELGSQTSARTWGHYKALWMAQLATYVQSLSAVPGASLVSLAACSSGGGHDEILWTDGSGTLFHRWWVGTGWSVTDSWAQPAADHIAALVRRRGDQLLFGVHGVGQVWVRGWKRDNQGWDAGGGPYWIPGEVKGPLTVVCRPDRALDLLAWTTDGRPCRTWLGKGTWAEWVVWDRLTA